MSNVIGFCAAYKTCFKCGHEWMYNHYSHNPGPCPNCERQEKESCRIREKVKRKGLTVKRVLK